MIAGVVLLLVLIQPDRTLASATVPMASIDACLKARDAYLAGPPDAHEIQDAEPLQFRSALCVTVPMPGRDA
jgi:hypothetical protein